LIVDEAGVFLDDPLLAGRIREWLQILAQAQRLGHVSPAILSDINIHDAPG